MYGEPTIHNPCLLCLKLGKILGYHLPYKFPKMWLMVSKIMCTTNHRAGKLQVKPFGANNHTLDGVLSQT